MRLQEYYSIFSVAYKLIVGFAAVGIINGVFMCLALEEMVKPESWTVGIIDLAYYSVKMWDATRQETFKVAASDDKLMMRQKVQHGDTNNILQTNLHFFARITLAGARPLVTHKEDENTLRGSWWIWRRLYWTSARSHWGLLQGLRAEWWICDTKGLASVDSCTETAHLGFYCTSCWLRIEVSLLKSWPFLKSGQKQSGWLFILICGEHCW